MVNVAKASMPSCGAHGINLLAIISSVWMTTVQLALLPKSVYSMPMRNVLLLAMPLCTAPL